MVDALLRASITRRWLIMFLVAVIVGAGVWSYQRLPIEV